MKALEIGIAEWTKAEPVHLVPQTNDERTRHSFFLRLRKPPDLIQWSLIASDAVNGLRSSLDHLIYAVAIKQDVFVLPDPPSHDDFAFPICSGHDAFANTAKRRLPKLSDAVRTAVERVQPYNRTHNFLPPPLGILRDLDNMNKHQLLQVAIAQMYSGAVRNLNVPIPAGQQINAHIHTAEVVDGTEIVAVIFPRPTPGVSYQFDAQIAITLAHATGPPPMNIKRTGVNMLLTEIADEVWRIINSVSAVA